MVLMDTYDMIVENPLFMLVTGLVLTLAGYQGIVMPDSWVLAMQPFGQLFNLLPNIVHQALGALITISGVGQVWMALQEY